MAEAGGTFVLFVLQINHIIDSFLPLIRDLHSYMFFFKRTTVNVPAVITYRGILSEIESGRRTINRHKPLHRMQLF